MSRYLFELEQNSGGKPVIYVGDLNVANEPIDLWGNHAANSQASGYTPEERDSFKRLLLGPRDDGGAVSLF
jgi:exonuclease III